MLVAGWFVLELLVELDWEDSSGAITTRTTRGLALNCLAVGLG